MYTVTAIFCNELGAIFNNMWFAIDAEAINDLAARICKIIRNQIDKIGRAHV